MRRLFLPETPCVKHTQLKDHCRLMRCAHRLRRKSLMIFELLRWSGMEKSPMVSPSRSGFQLVAALFAAVILVVDDIDGRLVAVQHTVQDAGLVAVQDPVIGQDAADTQIDAGRDDDKGAALVAVAGQDASQKTARIGLTNGSDSKNSGYTSELCNHFSLLFCLITPSGVTELYI
ncbi:hypothetical protein AGR7B_Lc150011 [Agrobacterium deltaense RV3]|nr:hypothetical protein AGR7B_Lc150011 [Agrobacterium deltaense RV3]